jgi:hypothetical protein
VEYRNHPVEENPFGSTDPLRVVDTVVMGVAASVATVGGVGVVN